MFLRRRLRGVRAISTFGVTANFWLGSSLLKRTSEMSLFVSLPSQTTTRSHKESELGAKLVKSFRKRCLRINNSLIA